MVKCKQMWREACTEQSKQGGRGGVNEREVESILGETFVKNGFLCEAEG